MYPLSLKYVLPEQVDELIDPDSHYEFPFTFTAKYQRISDTETVEKRGLFVDIREAGCRSESDNSYVLDKARLIPP
jgi:hypothetical protein